MDCPKCRSRMETVTHGPVEVDRCSSCRGLWFDMLEAEDLKALKDSGTIDIGDRAAGQRMNREDAARCPSCKSPMVRMVAPRQRHIWYESCGTCYGVFFDAGEFKDYREETVLDFFRSLKAPPRR